MSTQRDATDQLIETINATGGITRLENGSYAPAAHPEWTDLAQVYLAACIEKCVFPIIASGAHWDAGEDEEDDDDDDDEEVDRT
jgi:hypothetical protein